MTPEPRPGLPEETPPEAELLPATSLPGLIVTPLRPHQDDRGFLLELLRCDDPDFAGFGQVYLTTTYPGVVKAWHGHRHQTDQLCLVRGAIRLGLHDTRPDSPTVGQSAELYLSARCPCRVVIPPGLLHGWRALGTEEAWVLNVPDHPYDPDQPDEERRPAHAPGFPFDWRVRDR